MEGHRDTVTDTRNIISRPCMRILSMKLLPLESANLGGTEREIPPFSLRDAAACDLA